ncbi:hypothetical protein [Afipia sp. DC4300-2b1]|uniref:hypothetical protein n=1 Tax=Afipia sp. DC4300-2b1 TaxID=2804672 RepID=UPI003CEFB5D8
MDTINILVALLSVEAKSLGSHTLYLFIEFFYVFAVSFGSSFWFVGGTDFLQRFLEGSAQAAAFFKSEQEKFGGIARSQSRIAIGFSARAFKRA